LVATLVASQKTQHISRRQVAVATPNAGKASRQQVDAFSELSEWLGQRYVDILKQSTWLGLLYHPFDAISPGQGALLLDN
jgi:hypothetical protein